MRGFLFLWRGTCSRASALLILTLFHQLYLPPQQQYFLLLLCESIIEQAYGIFLVGHLGLYFIQLLS